MIFGIALLFWSLLFIAVIFFTWKKIGSRSKLYILFLLNMIYLCGVFLLFWLAGQV